MNNSIKVGVFEDNKDLREGITMILNASPGFGCCFASANCSMLEKDLLNNPDVVLMDIQMPGINGIEAVATIRQKHQSLPILMQTVFEDDNRIFAALCSGANGYLLKNTTPVKLLEAIREVYEGGSPMTPSIATKVLTMFKTQNANTKPELAELSKREKEILKLLSDGLSYKLIASQLFISYETVHSHVKKIYHKLHVNSVNEAISKALKNKMV